jgi:hypothetical protein
MDTAFPLSALLPFPAFAILLLRNLTAKGAERHEKGKHITSKYRENTQI